MSRFIRGFKFAFSGVWFCLTYERNFRFHAAATFYVFLFANLCGFSSEKLAILALTCAAVCSAEALNSAVEQIVDFNSPHTSSFAKVTKDISAGAVLIAALGAVAVAVFLFLPFFKHIIDVFASSAVRIVCLIASLILAAAFVFSTPPKPNKPTP